MWLPPHQQSTLTELFQAALVALCSKHIPFNGRLELDGLVCITNGDVAKQIVVKIHKVIEEHGNGMPAVATSVEQVVGLMCGATPVSVGQSLLKPHSNVEVTEGRLTPKDVDRKRQHPDEEGQGEKDFLRIHLRGLTPVVPPQNSPIDVPQALLKTAAMPFPKPDDQTIISQRELSTKPYKIAASERMGASGATGSPASKILVVDASAAADLRKFLPQSSQKKHPTQILELLTIPSTNRVPALPFDKLSGRLNEGRHVIPTKAESGLNVSGDKLEEHPVSCKLCATACQSRSALESHVRTAHRRFLCRICLNMFTLSCNLRRHMKLHAGVRPHACDQCSASFSRSTDLRIHMRKHEGRNGESSAPSTPKRGENLRCQICEQTFDSSEQLSVHRRRHEESLMLHGAEHSLGATHDEQYSDEEQDSPMELTINNNNKMDNGYDFSDNNNHKSYVLGGFHNGQFSNERLGAAQWASRGHYSDVISDFVPLLNLSNTDARLNRDSPLVLSARQPSDDNNGEDLLDLSSKDFVRNDDDDSDEPINYGKETSGDANMSTGSSTSPGISSRSKRKGLPMKITDGSALSSQPLAEDAECNEDSSDSLGSSTLQIALESNGAEDLSVSEGGIGFSEISSVGNELSGLPTPPPLSRKSVTDSDTTKGEESPEGDVVDRPPPPLTRKPNNMILPSTSLTGEMGGDAEQLEGCLFKCRHGDCETCWYGFKAYERHFAAAHNRFPCAHCDQSFTSRNNRRRHAIMHTDAKRHPCETCHKLFARPDIVKEHRLTHTRSYRTSTCSICGNQYDKKVALLSHLKKCLKAEDVDGDISLDAAPTADVSQADEEDAVNC